MPTRRRMIGRTRSRKAAETRLSNQMNAIAKGASDASKRAFTGTSALGTTLKRKAAGATAEVKGVMNTVKKNGVQFVNDVKKSGIHPMNDKGIIGDVSGVRAAREARKKRK